MLISGTIHESTVEHSNSLAASIEFLRSLGAVVPANNSSLRTKAPQNTAALRNSFASDFGLCDYCVIVPSKTPDAVNVAKLMLTSIEILPLAFV
jgi:hypothetical protein